MRVKNIYCELSFKPLVFFASKETVKQEISLKKIYSVDSAMNEIKDSKCLSVQFLAASHAVRDVTQSFRGLFHIITCCWS